MKKTISLLTAGAAILWAGAALAQGYAGDVAINEGDVMLGQRHYSPYLDQSYPNRPLFGDTHMHTSTSFDAGASGNRLDARAAYRFAKGEEVQASTGFMARLSRPLDFD